MSEHQASRTLLKSPPELWTECSDAQSLARHLMPYYGEIRITRLEPEITVAWEGDRISGTVRLEPSGWGTKVTLTVAGLEPEAVEAPEPAPEPVAVVPPEPAPEPVAEVAPADPGSHELQPPQPGLVARMRRWFAPAPVAPPPPPVSPPPPAPAVEEPEPEPEQGQAVVALTAALDSLGKAHHRPFSRA